MTIDDHDGTTVDIAGEPTSAIRVPRSATVIVHSARKDRVR